MALGEKISQVEMYCYDHWVIYQTKRIKSFETQLQQNNENKFGSLTKLFIYSSFEPDIYAGYTS